MNHNAPRLIFWELTRQCNLRCRHCRAEAEDHRYSNELSLTEVKEMIDRIASFASPILVLTGGEPLYRDDIFEIAAYGRSKGMHIALATNATLIDEKTAQSIREAGIERVSISIDGSTAASHDGFRGIPGSFDRAMEGARLLAAAGVPFQFNTTVTRRNVDELDAVVILARERGAVALHIFMLVPVGCGVEIAETDMLSRERYEAVLNWFYDTSKTVSMELKATCAPHYYRIIRQRARAEGRVIPVKGGDMAAMTRGCLAGTGVCFISHVGDVQPCGYLPVKAGNVRETDFATIWESSALFAKLRDLDGLKGKCGRCEYKGFCAGCRARAFYETGDYLEEEPYCVYAPKRVGK